MHILLKIKMLGPNYIIINFWIIFIKFVFTIKFKYVFIEFIVLLNIR
jgi:hypothetical protein